MIQAAPIVDWYERDERLLVLFAHRLIEPGPLVAAVLAHTSEPISFTDLVIRLVDELGAPEEGSAEALVDTCLEELASQGLVTRTPILADGGATEGV